MDTDAFTRESGGARYYFDWAAAAPPDHGLQPAVPFANPSSGHREGRAARDALEDARRRVAAALGAPAQRLFFTSGGTESNALAIQRALLDPSPAALLYSAAEHPSIRENALSCRRFGKAAHRIGVEKDGRVSEATLAKALDKHPEARFVALMGVNNETGAYTDVASLARFARARRAGGPLHIHSDLVQAAGKVPVSLSEWDIDSASLSGHKLGAPRGIGALYLRNPARALFAGGGQEGGVRGGTENTAGAVALAACLEARLGSLKEEYRLAAARFGRLIRFLRGLPGCVLIPEDRAEDDPRFSPYILQAAFRGIPGEVMVRILDDAGFAVSTGSACSARSQTRPVLAAMRLDPKTAREGIRISQGWSTTFADIDALISAVSAAGGGGTTASSGAAVSGH